MDLIDLVTEVIDLRSFSNLWYWIVLAILWSTLSHWTMGVPFHLVTRARRGHERSQRDMQILAEMNANRILGTTDASGPVALALACFVISGLGVTGFAYGVEFCQAIFFLITPAILVGGLSVLTARKLRARDYSDVGQALRQHRMLVQLLGVIFIFVTAFWGMWKNVNVGPLG